MASNAISLAAERCQRPTPTMPRALVCRRILAPMPRWERVHSGQAHCHGQAEGPPRLPTVEGDLRQGRGTGPALMSVASVDAFPLARCLCEAGGVSPASRKREAAHVPDGAPIGPAPF